MGEQLAWATELVTRQRKVAALVVPKGVLE
jgi:hypothetical protein